MQTDPYKFQSRGIRYFYSLKGKEELLNLSNNRVQTATFLVMLVDGDGKTLSFKFDI